MLRQYAYTNADANTNTNKKTNTHASIISQFDEVFILSQKIDLGTTFANLIYQINKYAPSEEFAGKYILDANVFLQKVRTYRELETAVSTIAI